jgi:hypothetical protein
MRVWNYCGISLIAFVLSLSGCSGGGHERFVPPIESAEEALETVLRAWKEGQPYKAIDDVEPTVQPVESRWQHGQKLQDYEILKQLDVKDSKQFQVRIKLEGAAAAEETTYVVLGKDPLYVYWITDYEQSSNTM